MKRIRQYMTTFVSVLVLLCLSLGALAQSTQISGKVVDIDNYPLTGASIVVEGTQTGTTANEKGEFVLNASSGQRLIVSFLGFKEKVVSVTSQTSYYIVLEEDANFLEETVVVGYDTQKKVNLTGSVSSISSETLTNRPITSASTALQGVAAGVTVTTQSGAPGGDSGHIRVRGIGTFGGSSAAPLVLIDGVEGSLNAVDASQIDQISVLKDAASSAIYGSRAANGVILVTTKRGKEGYSAVTYRGYVGWQTPTDLPETVNAEEYMTLSREADANDGKVSIYTDEYIANYRRYNEIDPDNYPITDWKKMILTGSGFTHNHNLSFTTSSDRMRVMTSLGYLSQDGIIKRTDYQRLNLRNNMDIYFTKKLRMRFDFSIMYGERNRIPQQNTIFNYLNTRDPLILTKWSSGHYPPLTGGSLNILPILEQGVGGNTKNRTLRLDGALSLTYDLFKWLTLEGKVAPRFILNNTIKFVDKLVLQSDAFGTPSVATNVPYNTLNRSVGQTVYGNYLFTANFHKTFAKSHNLKVLLGASSETYDDSNLSAYRQQFAYPQYQVISAGRDDETKDNSGTRYQWALLSYFGRINYNYKERYLFEANVRFDGSSRFAKGKRWGIFPSFSAAWRITEENWMEPAKNVLTELKLRASYGQLGNQNIGSSYYPTVQNLAISSISMNDVITPIVTLTTLANPDITWETSEMYNVGIDAALWNKLTLTADWYYKTTYGILMKLDIPQSIGLTAPYQNAGVVRNVGWEVALGYNDSWGDFSFGVNANLSDVKNKIIDMKGTTGGGGLIRNQEGSAINSIFGLKYLGMIKTQEEADIINSECPQYGVTVKPGDLYYADIAGAPDGGPDGKVDDNDKTIIGSTIPRYTFGLDLNFGWKGLNLSAFFQGVGKADSYLSGYYILPCYQGGTFRKEHLDRWTPETPNGKFPRMSYTDDISRKESTYWMKSAAYMRLKNLQLSYNLPKRVVNKLHLKNIMIFANAENLLTFDRFYQGFDPEVTYSGADDGVELGAIGYNYPQVKTFTFGIELKF